jgi:hypothetical protein
VVVVSLVIQHHQETSALSFTSTFTSHSVQGRILPFSEFCQPIHSKCSWIFRVRQKVRHPPSIKRAPLSFHSQTLSQHNTTQHNIITIFSKTHQYIHIITYLQQTSTNTSDLSVQAVAHFTSSQVVLIEVKFGLITNISILKSIYPPSLPQIFAHFSLASRLQNLHHGTIQLPHGS